MRYKSHSISADESNLNVRHDKYFGTGPTTLFTPRLNLLCIMDIKASMLSSTLKGYHLIKKLK